jgi:hypothetical protein
LKKRLSIEEKEGLDQVQISRAESYLILHGNTPLSDVEASPMFEAFLVGYSIEEVADRYSHVDKARLILTSALGKWQKKRQEVASSIYDRVRAKLIRSVVEQVDYMTDQLAVVSTEAKSATLAYLKDPVNNPLPPNRIKSIKEYRDAIEALTKLTDYVSKISGARDEHKNSKSKKSNKRSEIADEASILAELVGE